MLFLTACSLSNAAAPDTFPSATQNSQHADSTALDQQIVPHEDRWGIYRLDLDTQMVHLIFSSPVEIASLRLSRTTDRFVFSQKVGGDELTNEEMFTLNTDGSDMRRITQNDFWDLYPAWSPDGSKIAFLSQRSSSLGIYVMDADGSNTRLLYDSDSHEADIDWRGDWIVFTKDSSVWIMRSDGTGLRQVTNPPRAGVWGKANLPFGDYDPRISPDGAWIVFERLVDDHSPHGNYDLFLVDRVSSNEIRLTHSGFSQGLASWSNAGNQIIYIVSAIGAAGQYDLYMMDLDGKESRNITPSYFPTEFLCHWAEFSNDDSAIYFIGEWWAAE